MSRCVGGRVGWGGGHSRGAVVLLGEWVLRRGRGLVRRRGGDVRGRLAALRLRGERVRLRGDLLRPRSTPVRPCAGTLHRRKTPGKARFARYAVVWARYPARCTSKGRWNAKDAKSAEEKRGGRGWLDMDFTIW